MVFPEHFPWLIEVYSDGFDGSDPVIRSEFKNNGMFVINSEKIHVIPRTRDERSGL